MYDKQSVEIIGNWCSENGANLESNGRCLLEKAGYVT